MGPEAGDSDERIAPAVVTETISFRPHKPARKDDGRGGAYRSIVPYTVVEHHCSLMPLSSCSDRLANKWPYSSENLG